MKVTLQIEAETVKDAKTLRAIFGQIYPDTEWVEKAAIAAEVKQVVAAEQKPTPLEQAIAKLDETPTAADLGNPTEKLAEDPFAALSAGTETAPQTPAAEKPKKERKPKEPKQAPEPEKIEPKPLDIQDIRDASTVALDLIGPLVIQEALAKFEAVDKERNALRMSALAEADYGRYIEFLKKKVNDAAKEWPNA